MAHGTSKGQIDRTFSTRIDQLENVAQAAAAQFYDYDGFRRWATPDEMKDRDLLDVPGLHEPAWNRDEINKKYSNEVLNGPGPEGGTAGDLIAMKAQADFMAVEERAFRARHASLVRCCAHMHSRLDGHGQIGRGIFSFLRDGVQNAINKGRSHGK